MFTTGSKLLIGSAVLATIAAIVYGITRGGTLGTIGLVSAAGALCLLAGINLAIQDGNVSVEDAAASASPAARPAPAGSPWPLIGVVGAVVVAIGLVTYTAVTIVGLVVLILGTVEWMVKAWAERGSADERFNASIRERIAGPLEMPVLGAVFGGIIIFGFSRVMLSLSKVGTVVAFSLLAILVLLVAFLIAARPRLSTGTITGVIAIALFAVVTGGAVAALTGEREMHVIETTADLAAAGRCGPEATEADENFSQTVAAKSNPAAKVTLRADGRLQLDVEGFTESPSALTLPRSNPSNLLFRNEADQPRRLVIESGASGDDGPRTVCTALVEPGALQLLTVNLDRPSFAVDGGHRMTVPGVPSAVVDVLVP